MGCPEECPEESLLVVECEWLSVRSGARPS